MTTLTCANPACRKPFRATAWEVKHDRRYCSRDCMTADFRGAKRYNYKPRVTVPCAAGCGKNVEVAPTATRQQAYCSKACANRATGEAKRKPREMKTVVCKGCGGEFEVEAWKERTFCGMGCYQGWRKNHNERI